jgi:hypothetical protein
MLISSIANANKKLLQLKILKKVGNDAETFFAQATHDKTSLSFTKPSQIH